MQDKLAEGATYTLRLTLEILTFLASLALYGVAAFSNRAAEMADKKNAELKGLRKSGPSTESVSEVSPSETQSEGVGIADPNS